MTIREVVSKLALELAFKTGRIEDIKAFKEYLTMAVVVGTEHFVNTKEEIIAMDHEGMERGRFKSVVEASEKLGIARNGIEHVLMKRQHQAGGLMFVRSIDLELVIKNEDENKPVLSKISKYKILD
jgi:hypothetical protein